MFSRMKYSISKGLVLCAAALIVFAAGCGEEEGPTESSASKSSHNAGQDCTGCHSNTYAGTVYSDVSGSSTVAGAVVVITQNDGQVLNLTTDTSGNFYTQAGNPGGGYTATVQGNTVGMVAAQTSGACNSGACHNGSATTRIYVN